MRRSGAWIVGAVAAAAIALVLLLTSFTLSSSQEEGITVPSLAYEAFESPTLLSGKVSGGFTVPSGTNVTLMVFDGAEYRRFADTGAGTPLILVTGNNTTFSASLGKMGRLFVVLSNDGASPVYLRLHFQVTGLSLTVFYLVVALFVAGAVLAVIAWRIHKSETQSALHPDVSDSTSDDGSDGNQRI